MNAFIKPISVILKEARKNKGISLEDVYKATKIHPNILRALEEGTTLQLSGVYVRSYIKIYAKYLGINQKELDNYFQQVPVKEKKDKKIHTDIISGFKKYRMQNLPDLPSLFKLSSLRFQIKNYKNILIFFMGFLVLLALITFVRNSRSKDGALPNKVSRQKILAVSKADTTRVSSKEKEPKRESASKIQDSLRLTIFAEKDTWIQVKADGNVVFRTVLKKFSSETWQAKDNFELRISNAGTVKLELNGKILPSLGRQGQSLKSVLISRDEFTVKK